MAKVFFFVGEINGGGSLAEKRQRMNNPRTSKAAFTL